MNIHDMQDDHDYILSDTSAKFIKKHKKVEDVGISDQQSDIYTLNQKIMTCTTENRPTSPFKYFL